MTRVLRILTEEKDEILELVALKNLYLDYVLKTKRYGTYQYDSKNIEFFTEQLNKREITHLKQVTPKVMYDYIDSEKKRGISNNTINKRLEVFKRMLNYFERREIIFHNPMKKIGMLKKEKKETILIPTNLVKRIFEYLENQPETDVILRNKAIVYIFFDTGIRLNELLQLNIENLDLKQSRINLTFTKTGEHRTVFLSEKTLQTLKKHVLRGTKRNGVLFIDFTKRQRLKAKYVHHIFDRIKKDLGVTQSISPHKWRHTYATMCLRNGASLEFVRKTLGHTDLTTTQKYLHLNNDQLQDDHKQYSPFTNI